MIIRITGVYLTFWGLILLVRFVRDDHFDVLRLSVASFLIWIGLHAML